MSGLSRRRFAVLLASAPFLSAAAPTPHRTLSARQGNVAERILKELVDRGIVPGISYSIGDARETLLEGAFGLRSIAPRSAMMAATRCALASVSKQFASAAAFLLHQKGLLSLDAPLSTYLPEYKYARRMTLRQVLTMRAGIAADDEACEAPIDGKIDESTLIANLNKHELDFSPGDYFAYSNCGYDVAGVVLARVARTPYERVIAQNFFSPLGMSESYRLGARNDSDFAHGYAPQGKGWKPERATAADAAFASGNLVSTAGDMQRWNRSLLNAEILSRQSLHAMFTVPQTGRGAPIHYAGGWFVEPSEVIWHGGTLAGYGTVNMLIPATGHAITLLSNAPPGKEWKPEEIARRIYNQAELGAALPPLARRVRTTAPQTR